MFTGDRCFIGFNFQTDMRFIMNAIILILLFSFAFAESEQPDIATTTTSIASEGVSLTTSTEETQTNSTPQVTQNDTTATTSTSTLETTEEESTLMTTTTSIAQTEYNIRIDENDTILTENEIIHMVCCIAFRSFLNFIFRAMSTCATSLSTNMKASGSSSTNPKRDINAGHNWPSRSTATGNGGRLA